MPLFNTGKKKAEEQPQQEVPDELPDLPEGGDDSKDAADGDAPPQTGDSGAADTSKLTGQQSQQAPDELPPVDAPQAELAPDELPPVTQIGSGPENAHIDDQRLYFSQLLQKFHEEGLKSTKLSIPSVNLVSDMKKHWKKLKKAEKAAQMNRKVAETIAPLQKLEQEWMGIQEEIETKKKILQEKEEEIKKLSEELKQAAQKADKTDMKKK